MKLIVNVLNEIVGYLTLFGRLGGRTFNNTNNKYRDLTVNPFHTQIYLSFTIHEFWFFSVHFLRRRSFSLVPVLETIHSIFTSHPCCNCSVSWPSTHICMFLYAMLVYSTSENRKGIRYLFQLTMWSVVSETHKSSVFPIWIARQIFHRLFCSIRWVCQTLYMYIWIQLPVVQFSPLPNWTKNIDITLPIFQSLPEAPTSTWHNCLLWDVGIPIYDKKCDRARLSSRVP